MSPLVLVLLFNLGLAAVVLLVLAVRRRRTPSGRKLLAKGNRAAKDAASEAAAAATLRREDVAARLRAIAQEPDPAELRPGAMCYAPRLARQSAEYVCPACGARTLYTAGWAEWIESEVHGCRRAAAQIGGGLAVRLDESRVCAACSPRAKPGLAVEITLAGEPTSRRVEGVTLEDLKLLSEFAAGAKLHKGFHDSEVPLRKSMDRLEALLGVKRG